MYNIIAIEREFASGGNEIGEKLAKKLGYSFYNSNILLEAAKKLGIARTYIQDLEETAPGSVIYNLSATPLSGTNHKNNLPLSEQLFLTEKEIIEEKAKNGKCVIIGRCASQMFADDPNCLSVFVRADDKFRLKRAVEHEKVDADKAEQVLKKTDKRRKGFFNTHTKKEWGDIENYDICLDSSALGIERCVEILAEAAK